MTPRHDPSVQPPTDQEESLAQVLDEMVQALQQGRPLDLDDYGRRFPELADYLVDLLPSVRTLVELGGSVSRHGEPTDFANLEHAHEQAGTLGDFRLLRPIGQGGMGIVYEAQQISLSRRVALKVLPFAAVLDPQRLQRFKNEATAAASLDHPNIVKVYCVGCDRSVHYFAMQYIEGKTLSDALYPRNDNTPSRVQEVDKIAAPPATTEALAASSTLGDVDPRKQSNRTQYVARLGIQVAEALHYAHAIGIIHRDIKPSNLLVEASGKLYLTDFGVAHVNADAQLTISGDLLGTLRYMSPEQAAGNTAIDHRTDIYSLGVTLYELLAGQPAFSGEDRAQLLRSIAETDPMPLRRLVAQLPVDLETIVRKAMERDPVDRYQTAGELAADLRRFTEQRPILASPPTLWQRGTKWIKRHQRVAAIAAIVLLVACAGLLASTLLIARQRSIAERNAQQAEANLQLALRAMDETLSARVIGDLTGDQPLDRHEAALVDRGIDFYERFAQQNGVEPRAWPTYQRLLREKHLNDGLSLGRNGQFEQAAAAYRLAIREAEQLVAAHGDEPQYSQSLAFCYQKLADMLIQGGHVEEGEPFLRKGHDMHVKLAQDHPEQAEFRYSLGAATYNLARQQMFAGRNQAAEHSYHAALAPLEEAVADHPSDVSYARMRAMCLYNLGHLLGSNGRNDEARATWDQALTQWRHLADDYPNNSEYRSRVGATLSNLAVLAKKRGDPTTARQLVEEAIAHQQRAILLEPVYHNAAAFLKTHEKLLGELEQTQ